MNLALYDKETYDIKYFFTDVYKISRINNDYIVQGSNGGVTCSSDLKLKWTIENVQPIYDTGVINIISYDRKANQIEEGIVHEFSRV